MPSSLTTSAINLINSSFSPTAANSLISAAGNSPLFATEFNQYAAQGGSFRVTTDATLGTFTSTDSKLITIQSLDENNAAVLVDSVAYEFGHADFALGQPANDGTPTQNAQEGVNGEAVSGISTYLVDAQLGRQDTLDPQGTLQSQLNPIVAGMGGASGLVLTSSPVVNLVAAGSQSLADSASFEGSQPATAAPNLTLYNYYLDYQIIGDAGYSPGGVAFYSLSPSTSPIVLMPGSGSSFTVSGTNIPF